MSGFLSYPLKLVAIDSIMIASDAFSIVISLLLMDTSPSVLLSFIRKLNLVPFPTAPFE